MMSYHPITAEYLAREYCADADRWIAHEQLVRQCPTQPPTFAARLMSNLRLAFGRHARLAAGLSGGR